MQQPAADATAETRLGDARPTAASSATAAAAAATGLRHRAVSPGDAEPGELLAQRGHDASRPAHGHGESTAGPRASASTLRRGRVGVGVSLRRCRQLLAAACAVAAVASTAALIASLRPSGGAASVDNGGASSAAGPAACMHATDQRTVDGGAGGGGAEANKPSTPTGAHEPDGTARLIESGVLAVASPHEVADIARGSAVRCRGSDVDTRRCHVTHLCAVRGAPHQGDDRELAVVAGPETVLEGVPRDRFNPSLLSLGSVRQHNALHASLVDVTPEAVTATPRVWVVRAPALLTRRFLPSNVMHAVHDDVLPALHTLRETGLDGTLGAVLAFVDSRGIVDPTEALYDAARPSEAPLLRWADLPDDGAPVCFRSAHLGVSKQTTWYDYGFHRPQGPVDAPGTASPRAVEAAASRLARRLLQSSSSSSSSSSSTPPEDDGRRALPDNWHVVVLERRRNRVIVNQAELVAALEARFGRPVVTVSMETHGPAELAAAMHSAGVAVGMHGSVLIASVFMPRGATLVELFPFGVPPEGYTPYRTAARLLGLRYVAWANPNETATVTHPHRTAALGGIDHLPPDERRMVAAARTVPPHLCCTDPFWLYRIFSDTVVDVAAVVDLILDPAPTAAVSDSAGGAGLVPATPRGIVTCALLDSGGDGGGDSDVGGRLLRIAFEKSWSAELFEGVEYEVQVEALGQRWRTADNHLTLDAALTAAALAKSGGGALAVWVRAVTADRVGQFVRSVCEPRRQ